MRAKTWIKFWIETLDDPKMGRLADNLWRRFFECCLLAGEMQAKGDLPPLPDIAWRLRVDEEALRIEFEQLQRAGLLEHISNPLGGTWRVVNFAKRQARMSDAERQRQRRSRSRHTPVTYRDTNRHMPVTYRDIEEEEESEAEEVLIKLSLSNRAATTAAAAAESSLGEAHNAIATASGGLAIPAAAGQLQAVQRAIRDYGAKRTQDALAAAFAGWCASTRKNGQPYNPHNPGWIEWGVEALTTGTRRWERGGKFADMVRQELGNG